MRATATWRTLPTRRTFERRSTWLHAVVHCEDRAQSVVIRDISRGGMKIEFAYGLEPGDEIMVELMPGRVLEATVVWSLAAYCGVEFPAPLEEDDDILQACKRH
jgi:hypothetical protein